jgi:hypothetical protein
MGGGLMQLVAHGAQDVYLTSNADITFFKVVYRRHTNFAVEAIEQTFNGTADFGRKVSATVSRNADLVTRAYVQVDMPAVTVLAASTGGWVRNVGHLLLNNVSVDIGGQQIDKHYGEWLAIWASLTVKTDQSVGYDQMTAGTLDDNVAAAATVARTLYIPLQFWFCRNVGLALPLIARCFRKSI